MINIWDNYPDLKTELLKIKTDIATLNKTSEKYLDESLDYLMTTGGKMLRPAFVLIGAMFKVHDEAEKIANVAVAIETLHMATLIHDDIIDDSSNRRGKLSIQAKYSKEYAVYMGDYLFTQVFMLLSKYDYSRENFYEISRGISRVCIGEMLQHQMRFKTDVRTRDYLKIVSGKTAGLFAVSLGIGGHLAGVEDKVAKTLGRIGYNIGMAFQIIDDLLDYSGNDSVVGKDTLADLANGYFTLPVIYALQGSEHEELEKLLSVSSHEESEVLRAITLIKQSEGIDRASALAEKYTKRAIKHVHKLPDNRGKDILLELIPIMLKRDK